MKRIIFAFLALVIIGYAQWGAVLAGSTPATTPTWYNSADGTYNTEEQNNTSLAKGAKVVVGQNGNATKLRVSCKTNGATVNLKAALYDNAGTKVLVVSGGAISINSAGHSYKEFTITPTAVTSGTTYTVFTIGDSSSLYMQMNNATSTDFNRSVAYASFPEASFTPTATNRAAVAVSIYVE